MGKAAISANVKRMTSATPIRTLEDIRRLRPQIMQLAREYRAREISVFGSLVRGEAHASSDIDFLVGFESDYRLTDIIRLMQGLEELLGRKVDVVPRDALRQELRTYVLKEAQPL